MFFRQKRSGKYTYLQIVENRWEDGRSKQRVIVTLGASTNCAHKAVSMGYCDPARSSRKPWACRPRRPETKGSLLNGRTFRSLEHLNEVTRWWLAHTADVRRYAIRDLRHRLRLLNHLPPISSVSSLMPRQPRVIHRQQVARCGRPGA